MPFMHLIILLAFLLSSCIATDDQIILKNDINYLKRNVLTQESELSKIQSRIYLLEKQRGGNINKGVIKSLRESQNNLNTRFTQISNEMQLIQGRFDENRYFIEKALDENKTDRDVIKAEVDSLQKQLKESQSKITLLERSLKNKKTAKIAPVPTKVVSKKGPEKKTTSEDSKAVYKDAYETFKSKQYKSARDKFQDFIKKFPKDALIDNAHFWIAETYYKEENYEDAIFAYDTVIKEYPKSEKMPAALLKQAYSFFEIQDKRATKVLLQQLIERFPKSKEAELAKKKLESLKKQKEG